MFKQLYWLILLILLFNTSMANVEIDFANTHITYLKKNTTDLYYYLADYNKLRTNVFHTWGPLKNTLMVDWENFMGKDYLNSASYTAIKNATFNLPFTPYRYLYQSDTVAGRVFLHRAYTEIQNQNNTLAIGLQSMPMGVGRIWAPLDVFNLFSSYHEIAGVLGIKYTHYLNDLSFVKLVTNFKEEFKVDKYGGLCKTHVWGSDIGLTLLNSENFMIIGGEIEANLLDTGIEVRAEGGRFDDKTRDSKYIKYILGADYAFPNMVTLAIEYFFNGLGGDNYHDYDTNLWSDDNGYLAKHYLGSSLGYVYNPLINFSNTNMVNLVDGSVYSAISAGYSLNDNASVDLTAVLFYGQEGSEFKLYSNSYYLRWSNYF